MSVVQRSVKIVLASILALFVADSLKLSYATSAGIIAILGVLDTRRSSFEIAIKRTLSTILGLLIAILVFAYWGYSMASLSLFLIVYVPIANLAGLAVGIAPSSVLVTHLWLEHSISSSLLLNEFALFLVGTGAALLANSYMVSKEKAIQQYHLAVEASIKEILLLFAQFLLQGDGRNQARRITKLDDLLKEALETVYHDRHNQVFNRTNYEVHYFEMRQQQAKALRAIARNINYCHLASDEADILAGLFEQTAKAFSRDNPVTSLLAEIEASLAVFRNRDLPKTRQEFEQRARLFQLLHDLQYFLQIKADFYANYG
ncbi:aromatic acid exporter family protein [Streptococcus sp. zg-JUN1979]|uniref:aromatic acid exporter family protein n=1 Tax=Streptococcus sp. zg-JUN1979 TaxID=3391450 RepID=UPI0039A4D10E